MPVNMSQQQFNPEFRHRNTADMISKNNIVFASDKSGSNPLSSLQISNYQTSTGMKRSEDYVNPMGLLTKQQSEDK